MQRREAAGGGEADAGEDLGDPRSRLAGAEAVEPRGVREVLLGAHPLEEARLDRDAIHHLPHRAGIGEDVAAEDARGAAVVEEKGREQADERRLARAVAAQDRDALTGRDDERHAVERGHAFLAGEAPGVAITAQELLAEVARLDCGYLVVKCKAQADSF